MSGYITKSGNYDFKEFGIVRVNVKTTTKRVIARWKAGAIVVSAPTNIPYDNLLDILREFAPKMQMLKPSTRLYSLGETIDFGELKVKLESQTFAPDRITAELKECKGVIRIGADWDMEAVDTIKTVSKFICRMAQRIAPDALIPRAKEVATRVGKWPLGWKISNGHRVLGTCDANGIIALSYALLFYPPRLRDYVICHELAHLTELNHSPRFHEICNAYCCGQEGQLEAEFKAFRPRILR